MTVIRPFFGVRPTEALASSIAALPYDVYTRTEAKNYTLSHPLSFLNIDRPETQFSDDTDMYSQQVYDKANELFENMLDNGSFIQDDTACYYLYALTMNGRTQTGLVGCASIDDYLNGTIKKHENTREEKELDRIRHVDTMSAQTGPIFLTYRPDQTLKTITDAIKQTEVLYQFTSEDGITHQVWKISEPETVAQIADAFSRIEQIYIADGHHRAASAVKVGLKRRKDHPDHTGKEEFNYFLSVLFSSDELKIYDYNRVVTDLAGHSWREVLEEAGKYFTISDVPESYFDSQSESSARTESFPHPQKKGEIILYGNNSWYLLNIKPEYLTGNPVDDLDVSLLQQHLLTPVFQIQDPRTDKRIDFIGGIFGVCRLKELVDSGKYAAAFVMYPTSMQELLNVADEGLLMPPKSTWFEPKLRSGLFIHRIER